MQENAGAFQNHVQSFFNGDQRSRSQPRTEKQEKKPEDEEHQRASGQQFNHVFFNEAKKRQQKCKWRAVSLKHYPKGFPFHVTDGAIIQPTQ